MLDNGNRVIRKSHAFQLENYSLMDLEKALPYPVVFENDGNAAALSEKRFRTGTAFYLSLNATVGGAFSVNGKPYGGVNNKSSEIGHMILFPRGRPAIAARRAVLTVTVPPRYWAMEIFRNSFLCLRTGMKRTD